MREVDRKRERAGGDKKPELIETQSIVVVAVVVMVVFAAMAAAS